MCFINKECSKCPSYEQLSGDVFFFINDKIEAGDKFWPFVYLWRC